MKLYQINLPSIRHNTLVMKNKRKILGFILLLGIAYLLFYPVPIDPAAWTPPVSEGIAGQYAVSHEMTHVQRLFDNRCEKCEDVAIDKNGFIYGGTETGKILRFDSHDAKPMLFADTEGRPLGMMFNQNGYLIVADSRKGLLSIDSSGKITPLVSEYEGHTFRFTDDLDIDSSGIIYFTDASKRFEMGQFTEDLMEHRPNGWFFSYNPHTKETKLLLDSLYFANGVALSKNEDFVLINETGKYRIQKYWLKGEKTGTSEIFKENLPAFNDGISSYDGDVFWVAMVSPRTKLIESILPHPFLRKMVIRLPKFLHPAPERFCYVLGLDHNGNVVYSLQDPTANFTSVSNVIPVEGGFYFGTLTDHAIGYVRMEL